MFISNCESISDWLGYMFINRLFTEGICVVYHTMKQTTLLDVCENQLPAIECFL